MDIPPIISAQELADLIGTKNLVIADAGSGTEARERYVKEHISGSHYVDLNEDLAEVPADAKNGGRHPLPSLDKFAALLASLGITRDSHVIVYDDKNAANAAARFWWMLRAAGYTKVQVLDGGLQEAIKNGIPVNVDIPKVQDTELPTLETWSLPTIDLGGVDAFSKNSEALIIDVRENERYRGETEPIDLVAGHIPRAINLPFKNNLDGDGKFKKPEVLKAYFTEILGDHLTENIAVHCGSGVTACHTLLAMHYAGLSIPKLYVGSWSEWSRNFKPVEKL